MKQSRSSAFAEEWDNAARDVRAALAACTVQIVNEHTDYLTSPDAAQVCAEVWGEMTGILHGPGSQDGSTDRDRITARRRDRRARRSS